MGLHTVVRANVTYNNFCSTKCECLRISCAPSTTACGDP